MKKQYVGSVKAGDKVDDVFVLYEKNLAQKKDGSDYLNITLSDKTGKDKRGLYGTMWVKLQQAQMPAILFMSGEMFRNTREPCRL